MPLFEELKRRNVFRVGIAYIVVAWLILQLADVLISLLELPAWTGRLVFLVVLIGLPIALFLAWAYEMTPEGIKPERDVDRTVPRLSGRKLDFLIIGGLVVHAVDEIPVLGDG